MKRQIEAIQRNYGIDLIRVVSMIYVIVLHTLGQGGVLKNVSQGSSQYAFAWALEIWAYCAVDIFALISGYVGYHEESRNLKYSNYILLWAEVVFYGVCVTSIMKFLQPDLVTKKDFLQMLSPVTSGLYWYFTAYTGVFVLMPLLNSAIRKLSMVSLKKILLLLFISFSVFGSLFDRFNLNSGYSTFWILLLYLTGAIIKKCNIGKNVGPVKCFILICILMLITWGWKLWIKEDFRIIGNPVAKDYLISYTSPTVVCTAALYLIGASKLKISKHLSKIIEFFSSSAFAAYILNNQRFIWSYGMRGKFTYIANLHAWLIPVYVLGFAVMFVLLAIIVDKVRESLFKILRIKKFAITIEMKTRKVLRKFN